MSKHTYEFIREMLERNENLVEFAEECIKHIFGEDARQALIEFHENYDKIEQGCVLSLHCMLKNARKQIKESE